VLQKQGLPWFLLKTMQLWKTSQHDSSWLTELTKGNASSLENTFDN